MKFSELIHELECDYGRIHFRERLMLRRAYDVIPEQEDDVEEESEDVYKQYQERSMYFTAPSKTILAQKIATTSMKCLKCGTVMLQQQYFGGGIYWLCGKCGSKAERTGL